MMQPRVIILRDGVDATQGKGQVISNINACEAICEILKTTLGPRGMDKLIHDGDKVTISNDGATIIHLLDIVHPAAKSLVDIAKSQDDEVGDGTTTVTLLAGEMLRSVKIFVEDGVHPQTIIKYFRLAVSEAQKKLKELMVDVGTDSKKKREMLMHCAGTALNSKLISHQKDFFAKIAVDSIMHLDEDLDLKNIGIKRIPGGSITDSFLVEGVAFKKTFAYAGFEQQPKNFDNPKVLILNVELELKSERQNAEIRINDPSQYQSIVDAEWKIIYEKLELISKSGAKIVLSRLPIGDLATQYFADRDIFCAGRVPVADLERMVTATGGKVQTSLQSLTEDILGVCGKFEEKQIGAERFNLFTGCPKGNTVSIILRGGAAQFIAESERSLHDAIMIVKRAKNNKYVVGGGGAIEMELSRHLRAFSKTIKNKGQLIINAYAHALEVIPRQLAHNAGFDSTDIVNELRALHSQPDGTWMGVDVDKDGCFNTYNAFIWEPVIMKQHALGAATEAACMVLSIDETVKNPSLEQTDDRPVDAPHRQRRRKY